MTRSSDLSSKAHLSAYQRWELASLAESNDAAEEAEREAQRKAELEREAAAAAAAAAEKARLDGYAAGYAAGLAQASEERAQLVALLASIQENAGEHRQKALDAMLDFSLLLARQMVSETLNVRRDLVLPVVSAALRQVPEMSGGVQLALNPADVDIVRQFLANESTPVACTLASDATILPGGCRIVTPQCDVDATVQTRWRRVLANLGCGGDWLASD